jgi:hypothetical protein
MLEPQSSGRTLKYLKLKYLKVFALMNIPARIGSTISRTGASSLSAATVLVLLQAGTLASTNIANGDVPVTGPDAALSSGAGIASDVPSGEQLANLLHTTLAQVDHGNKTGDYAGLYTLLTPQVQQKVDVQKLANAMAGFRKLNVDMEQAQKILPRYDQMPQLTTEGMLTLRGTFPTQPRVIRFDLSYVRIGDSWRLQVLNLDTPPAQVAAAAPVPARAEGSPAAATQAPPPAAPQAPPSAPAAAGQGGARPSVSINSPFLDTSTDPPTASKW